MCQLEFVRRKETKTTTFAFSVKSIFKCVNKNSKQKLKFKLTQKFQIFEFICIYYAKYFFFFNNKLCNKMAHIKKNKFLLINLNF